MNETFTGPDGNPQGKGNVPVLDAWRGSTPQTVSRKSSREVLKDYSLSLLVLSAEFNFKPVVGQSYFLYWRDGNWFLTMIAPHEAGKSSFGEYLGRFELQADMTWQLEETSDLGISAALKNGLTEFQENLTNALDTETPFVDQLPFFIDHLPFYRRMAASALARSVQLSADEQTLAGSGQALLLSNQAVLKQLLKPEA